MSYIPTDGVRAAASDIADAGRFILADPALPDVASVVVDIYNHTPTSAGAGGVGARSALRSVIVPLRAYAYMRKHPWALWLGIAAVVGIPFFLGYSTRRK